MAWGTITSWVASKIAGNKINAADINLLNTNALQVYDNTVYLKDAVEAISLIVGEIKFMDDYYAPSASFPWKALTDDDSVLTTTNWPDLVPHLRAKTLKYKPGTSSSQSAFNVTNWAISTNVATLTFSNLTPENAILAALAEDKLVHGSFTAWRTITLASAIGSITAGTYAITAMSTSSRTISFAFTGTNGSGSVTATVAFYPHRLSTADDAGGTQARHFKAVGEAFHTVNDADNSWIGGLRRRFRMQGHIFYNGAPSDVNLAYNTNYGYTTEEITTGRLGTTTTGTPARQGKTSAPKPDGVNGTPLIDNKTHSPGFGVFAYLYGGSYSA